MTLAEYLEANKEKAENKVFYTTDETLQAAAISLYTEQGIHVAVLNSLIDVNFISFMEYKNTDVKFSRVDAALDGLKADDPARKPRRWTRASWSRCSATRCTTTSWTFPSPPLKNETLPAMATEDEQMRRFKDMSRIYGGSFAMPSQVKLALNRRCPVIAALSKREANEDYVRNLPADFRPGADGRASRWRRRRWASSSSAATGCWRCCWKVAAKKKKIGAQALEEGACAPCFMYGSAV